MMKIDLVGGARPNFTKLGPIYREMKKRDNFEPRFVYTRQHVVGIMSTRNWGPVGLQNADVYLKECHIQSNISCIPDMMVNYNLALEKNSPDIVLVVGDTDSALIAAFVAKRNNIPVVHVEAGVKGHFNEPEEYNRRMIDSISDLLLAPTWDAVSRLRRRNARDRTEFVGNVMIDALKFIVSSKKWPDIKASSPDVLVTLHRPYNIDDFDRLLTLINEMDFLASIFDLRLLVHPRMQNNLHRFFIFNRPYFHPPLPYDEFIKTLSQSKIVITDSGGLQVEAAYFNVPCIAVIQSKLWPELVDAGAVKLCPDLDFSDILEFVENYKFCHPNTEPAAKEICDQIEKWYA